MEYTVKKLAGLAGVSARTLRYYDEIGLLSPARISSSGYRIYGSREVDLLQQILLYREMGLPLEEVALLLKAEGFCKLEALRRHEQSLLTKRRQLDALIHNVRRSISAEERGIPMADQEKFEGFKKSLIDENEKKYGAEARAKYGDRAVDASNAKLMGLDAQAYAEMQEAGERVLRLLNEAFEEGDVQGASAGALAEAHKAWLSFTWAHYSAEAHAGLVRMYVEDERFAAYYGGPEKAAFLRDSVLNWLA